MPRRNAEAVEDPELCRSFLFRLNGGRSAGRLNRSASSPEVALNSSVDEPVAEEPPEMFRCCYVIQDMNRNASECMCEPRLSERVWRVR